MDYFITNDKVNVTVDTLYQYAKDNNTNLLPSEAGMDFWLGYDANHARFDRYFWQKFRAFKIDKTFDADTSTADMLTDFKALFDVHLFLNQKRYSELYRVQVLAADAYDVVNNYDVTESYQRDNTGTQTMAEGQRTDSTQYGQRQNTNQYGQTQQTTQYGQKQLTDVNGQRQDSNQTTLGQQTSTSTDKRSAFNSSSLQDVGGGNIQNGSRQDSSTLTTGTQTNTHTDAQHTDTVTGTQHTDTLTESQHTDTLTKGQQSNTRTDALKEVSTLHRYGNIGVQTPADVIGGHIDLWKAFKFYQMIFDEFADEYLIIDVDFDFLAGTASGGSGGGGGDAELLQAIRQLSTQLTLATASINNNVDSAETNIKANDNANTNTLSTLIGAAKTSADNAKNSADLAKLAADNAKTAADGAKTSADNAKTAADGAKTSADNAFTAASNSYNTTVTFGNAIRSDISDLNGVVVTFGNAIRADIGAVTTQDY